MNPDNMPIIRLEGSSGWERAYEAGKLLEWAFPRQDGHDFAHALSENDYGPVEQDYSNLVSIDMLKQGERDAGDWIWRVTLSNGEVWTVTGWCDYTGWDCQSGVSWTKENN